MKNKNLYFFNWHFSVKLILETVKDRGNLPTYYWKLSTEPSQQEKKDIMKNPGFSSRQAQKCGWIKVFIDCSLVNCKFLISKRWSKLISEQLIIFTFLFSALSSTYRCSKSVMMLCLSLILSPYFTNNTEATFLLQIKSKK